MVSILQIIISWSNKTFNANHLLKESKYYSSPYSTNKDNRFSKFQCFGCKKYGHTTSHFKKRNICTYCKKSGDIISECRSRPSRGVSLKMRYAPAPSAFKLFLLRKHPLLLLRSYLIQWEILRNQNYYFHGRYKQLVQSSLASVLPSTISSEFLLNGLTVYLSGR